MEQLRNTILTDFYIDTYGVKSFEEREFITKCIEFVQSYKPQKLITYNSPKELVQYVYKDLNKKEGCSRCKGWDKEYVGCMVAQGRMGGKNIRIGWSMYAKNKETCGFNKKIAKEIARGRLNNPMSGMVVRSKGQRLSLVTGDDYVPYSMCKDVTEFIFRCYDYFKLIDSDIVECDSEEHF